MNARELGRNTLSDDALLVRLIDHVGRSRHAEAELVALIAEVDARRLYRREACPSIHAYVTERLHMSSAEAYLRITVARLSRRFPIVLAMLADGRLHLSGIARLAPHLSDENASAVLHRAVRGPPATRPRVGGRVSGVALTRRHGCLGSSAYLGSSACLGLIDGDASRPAASSARGPSSSTAWAWTAWPGSGSGQRSASLRPMAAPALVPELEVSDLSRSLAVYVGVFGFSRHVERPEERFAYLVREGAHLMLEEATGPGRRFHAAPLERPFGRGLNLQIEVSNVDALYADVQRSDLEIRLPLEERWYRHDAIELGQRQFVVADPDGYLLRFFGSLGTRPARLSR